MPLTAEDIVMAVAVFALMGTVPVFAHMREKIRGLKAVASAARAEANAWEERYHRDLGEPPDAVPPWEPFL